MSGVRLHLGCGRKKKQGWINIDINSRVKPDLITDAKNLHVIVNDAADEIASFHLFEHFTYADAVIALREWHRVLKKGGKLSLELPNFERCIEILYKREGVKAENSAMMGIYGCGSDIRKDGINQLHKYGWTPETLTYELRKTGFRAIRQVPVTQRWRPAAKYNRDMRLECLK